jgi:hypothetical protein
VNQVPKILTQDTIQHKSKDSSLSEYDKLSEREKIIFLAGVFDGEGSFGYWSQGRGKKRQLQVKVETTDSDMVARFQEFFGGTFFVIEKRKHHFKHTFIKLMIPYMCQRRREKFYGLVKPTGYGSEDWGSHLQKQTRIQEINVGCTEIARRENGSRRN